MDYVDMLESDKARVHLDHVWWTTPTFLLTGVILTAKFIYYEVTHRQDRDIWFELMLAVGASIFLGIGTLYLCITLGIPV